MNNRTVILDGLSGMENIHPAAQLCYDHLKKLRIPQKTFFMARDDIAQCLSCGVCGNKTPGLCFRKDKGAELTARISQSDLIIVLTQVRYGAYEPRVKKAIDRLAILGSPFFVYRNKQMFHKFQYDCRPNFLIFALAERPALGLDSATSYEKVTQVEKEVFEALVQRDSEHFQSEKCKVVWLEPSLGTPDQNIQEAVASMFKPHERQVL